MTARLPHVVGQAMARRLSMTGEVVDAARAERIGLVTEVVPHERLLDRALELAAQIAEVPGPTMLGSRRSTRQAPPQWSTQGWPPRRRSRSPSIGTSMALAISSGCE
jgi:enoyl-CoA hydratase/carnithine racemase